MDGFGHWRLLGLACRRQGIQPGQHLLVVVVLKQTLCWYQWIYSYPARKGHGYKLRQRFCISTSRYGTGQREGSRQTPLGLHRIAEKIGGGLPPGTVFKSRQPSGLTWQGQPQAAIAHRILWLEGLEPGLNQGPGIDTHARYIYIHGIGDETTLGRPVSQGCVHMASADLLPLFDRIPIGTLVWIQQS